MIEARAFYNCEAIESMILPRALETIGTEAFANCLSLKSITLPPEVEMDIDFSRFYNVPSLEEIKFEEGWQTIQLICFLHNLRCKHNNSFKCKKHWSEYHQK